VVVARKAGGEEEGEEEARLGDEEADRQLASRRCLSHAFLAARWLEALLRAHAEALTRLLVQ